MLTLQVDLLVNNEKVNLPMKLGDGGEAFFVFETEGAVPSELLTSPVISPSSSPTTSPSPPSGIPEPEFLDLDRSRSRSSSPDRGDASTLEPPSTPPNRHSQIYSSKNEWSDSFPTLPQRASPPPLSKEQIIERARQLSRKLTDINIPSKVSDNGDVVLDITGYKSDEADFKQSEEVVKKILMEEFGEENLEQLLSKDNEGNLRIFGATHEDAGYASDDMVVRPKPNHSPDLSYSSNKAETSDNDEPNHKSYAKTLRLTSDQLKSLNLKPGTNDLAFSVNQGKAVCTAKMFYWKYDVPIVISDIDGTITKSDALGHVLAMIGRDWTHPGVGKLFTDIANNGYNVMYLTARSVGQADSTRYYLQGIDQNGYKLPDGPVILSPDRTMAALRREVIMRKPEVFKMACLRDIKGLYGELVDETPFFAGFGNRITDALSYRSVGVPSARIFTINSLGDVHMELLELAGYKSSYVHIADLVDHFFPPVKDSFRGKETYTDLNYWREPIADLSEWESDEDSVDSGFAGGNATTVTSNPADVDRETINDMARSPRRKRIQQPLSTDEPTSPLAQVGDKQLQPSPPIFEKDPVSENYSSADDIERSNDDYDEDGLDLEEVDDEYDDDYEDEDEIGHGEDDYEDEDYDEEEEEYDEDEDYDEEIFDEEPVETPGSSQNTGDGAESPKIVKASELVSKLEI